MSFRGNVRSFSIKVLGRHLCLAVALISYGSVVFADARREEVPANVESDTPPDISNREWQEVARVRLRACYESRASSNTIHAPNQSGDGVQCHADCYSDTWREQLRGHTDSDHNRQCYQCAEHFCPGETHAFDAAYNRHGQERIRGAIRAVDRVVVQPAVRVVNPPAPSLCYGDRLRADHNKACCTYDWGSAVRGAGPISQETCSKGNEWRHLYASSCTSSDHSRAAARTRRTSRALMCRCIYQTRREFLPPEEERRLLINNGGGRLPDNELCSKYIRLGHHSGATHNLQEIAPTHHSGATEGPGTGAE